MRVMLVDDSSTMRRILRTQLNGLGVTDIVEAGNGEEALSVLADTTGLDFILLDWNMPVMDGSTFLKLAREKRAYSSIKILMCTSESEKDRVVEALRNGANDYIVKPFTPETIKEKLKL